MDPYTAGRSNKKHLCTPEYESIVNLKHLLTQPSAPALNSIGGHFSGDLSLQMLPGWQIFYGGK